MKPLRKTMIRLLRRGLAFGALAIVLALASLAAAWWWFPFPVERLDRWPQSPRVMDRNGEPLLELVGGDDQWRMEVDLRDISPWLIEATIAVEDERFRSHAGVDPIAVVRAMGQNVGGGRIVSGASTLSMQVCRMMDDRPRTWRAKIMESFRALQLERSLSKDQILAMYLNIAPFGGNLRGVEAASRSYFGKRARDLSLAEAALMAGLPQSPSRLRPDRHMARAKVRQRVVLRRMVECGIISKEEAEEASNQVLEVARKERSNPRRAGAEAGDVAGRAEGVEGVEEHGAWFAMQRRPMGGVTTLDARLQRECGRLSREHLQSMPGGSDAAVVIIDIASGHLLAMVGSAAVHSTGGGHINVATARRSPGSTLKPFVYAAGFDARRLNDQSILFDGPIERGGWSPTNFDRSFAGEVTVRQALRRSLNVPAILAAEGIGLARCVGVMEAAGIALPGDAGKRGGLAVVTGAVEVSLLDVTNGYATIGRGGVGKPVIVFADEASESSRVLSAESCAMIDDILSSMHQRPAGMSQLVTEDVPWFMWKTGTSSGRRDAWAVGHNRQVAIGVWIGRQSGSGDVQFVGGEAAEPLLARLFNLPALRVATPPTAPDAWVVTHPLPVPVEQQAALRITSPAAGGRFIAAQGRAIIHPRRNRTESPAQWFLNGRLVEPSSELRLELVPGEYELRCVESDGTWARVTFDVRP